MKIKKCGIGIQYKLGNKTIKNNDERNFYYVGERVNIPGEVLFEPLNYSFESDYLLLKNDDIAKNELGCNSEENEYFIVY